MMFADFSSSSSNLRVTINAPAAIGIRAHSEASHPRTVGECSVRRAVVDGRKDVYWPSALAGGAILFGPLRIARPVRSRQRAAPPLSYGPSRARPRTDGRTGIKRPTNRPIGTIYVRDRRPQPVNDCRLQDYGERKCADTVGTVLVPLAAWRIAAFVA